MSTLADDLYVLVKDRLGDLQRLLESLEGRIAGSATAERSALALFATYRELLDARVEADARFNVPDRLDFLRLYSLDIGLRLEELEEWFIRGFDTGVPSSLVDAVAEELTDTLGIDRHVVLAIGPPNNMATLVDELSDLVFASLREWADNAAPGSETGPSSSPDGPPSLDHVGEPELGTDRMESPDHFALIQISRLEAANPIWRPLIVGHELAHLAFLDKQPVPPFDLTEKLRGLPGDFSPPDYDPRLSDIPDIALEDAALDWFEELVCDAYSVQRWGPAAIAALGSYLESVGGMAGYGTHPPGWFRLRCMLSWLGPVDAALLPIIEPWMLLASHDYAVRDAWASNLLDVYSSVVDVVPSVTESWASSYDHRAASTDIASLARGFRVGIPLPDRSESDVDGPTIVNAGWLARSQGPTPSLYRLVDYALEAADFLQRWSAAGGDAPPQGGRTTTQGWRASLGSDRRKQKGSAGLLTEAELRRRCTLEGEARLVISPYLDRAIKDTAIDLRLGRRFIVFQRSSVASFGAAVDHHDPRTMQRLVERRWGSQFVLHPGELVLASTLEYLSLPPDLAGQVITRSSYGRLGLLTATAIQVHPSFTGCLTLELVNLGSVPITLQPGERVAQLAISKALPPLAPREDATYAYPTGPEFSRVRKDWDLSILRRMGERAAR